MESLKWSALEYEEKERSADWFWALGIIVVTISLAGIIYENYFFAALMILSGILLGFFAKQPPDLVNYELGESGLKIKDTFYSYKNIKSFWVQAKEFEPKDSPIKEEKAVLFVKTERLFMPVISIPIEEDYAFAIRSIFLNNDVAEEVMREHLSLKIMEFLGF